MTIEIIKEAVTAYVVIKSIEAGIVFQEPLVKQNGFDDDNYVELRRGEEVIAVVPAAPGTFLVSGWYNDQFYELGYEMPGAWVPDWKGLLMDKVKGFPSDSPSQSSTPSA